MSQCASNNFTATSLSTGGVNVDANEKSGSSINRASDTFRYVKEC